MFLTAAFLSCHSRFFWGIKIYRKMAKITIYFYQKLFSQFSHQYLVFCRSNDKDKNGTKIAKRKKRLLNLTRSVTFSSILVSTNSQFTIRKKRHQTLQCSILIAVISRLQYANSLPSTNFKRQTDTKLSSLLLLQDYIIQTFLDHGASNQILVQGRRTIENSSLALERLATSCAGI